MIHLQKCRLQFLPAIVFFLFAQNGYAVGAKSNVLKLWYNKPAEYFEQALPIGNGRLAAMVYSRSSEEIINLNEGSFWSGGPVTLNPNPDARQYLPEIRKALDDKNYAAADKTIRKMQGYYTESYEPIGDLIIKQHYNGMVKDYYRDLDLTKAIATTHFKVGNVLYTRQVFVSYPDQVIVVRLTSSIPKALNLSISTKTQMRAAITLEGKELVVSGRAPSHADPSYAQTSDKPVQWGDNCKGMRFQTRIKAIQNDGKLSAENGQLNIVGASQVVFAVSIATSFNGFDKCPVSQGKDEKKLAKGYLDAIRNKTYSALLKAHVADYSNYFGNLKFYLSGNKLSESLPTDERLIKYQTDRSDHGLEVLLYQYGRYLLISSSRKGGIAANLQGKWSIDVRPPWSCNYTTNINLEMNYWAAEKVGLGDMDWPMIQQVVNMSKTGKYIAKYFCNCRGWAAAHNSDIWATANPVGNFGQGDPQWANWVMASPWLCEQLWEKYAYQGDKPYLRNVAYPVMKEAALFCLDWLVDDGHGHFITSPSTSSENRFIGEDGKDWSVTKGATMDLGLIRNLFENTLDAMKVLHLDTSLGDSIKTALGKMLPYQIGAEGDLNEWEEDYADADPNHRHISHLICLHPGHDISANETPDLFEACKKSLIKRGDGGTGWSRTWKICCWSRLLDGDHAYKLLQNDLSYVKHDASDGGTYANLFNACPPLQIDGNFGVVEGISEMLMQSHLHEIYLLPALPSAWQQGSISGLKARGGYDVSMQWDNGKLQTASIHCRQTTICRLRTNSPIIVRGAEAKSVQQVTKACKSYFTTFKVQSGKTYQIGVINN
jgi:alpha-L-fucosidase 2